MPTYEAAGRKLLWALIWSSTDQCEPVLRAMMECVESGELNCSLALGMHTADAMCFERFNEHCYSACFARLKRQWCHNGFIMMFVEPAALQKHMHVNYCF